MKVCELCGGKDHMILYEGNIGRLRSEGFSLVVGALGRRHESLRRCLNCGLVFVDKKRNILGYYRNLVDLKYQDEGAERSRSSVRVLREIKRYKGGGKLLDVGAATGIFLNEAKKRGFEVFGVEPSRWAAAYAKKNYGIDIFPGTLEEARFPDKHFDVVSLLDVVEHVSQPTRLLLEINRVLKDDGLLCLATPNIESFVAKVLGERWWHILPNHLYYFSDRTLNRLLGGAGFKILGKKTFCRHFSLSSLLTRLIGKDNVFRNRFLKRFIIPIDLRDSLEVYVEKI